MQNEVLVIPLTGSLDVSLQRAFKEELEDHGAFNIDPNIFRRLGVGEAVVMKKKVWRSARI